MRAFIAIFPPLSVRKAVLAGVRQAVRHSSGNYTDEQIRWIKPENVHLTLKFLGDIRGEILKDLSTALAGACSKHSSFEVGLLGFGAFPSARRVRILWAGVGTGSEQLRCLAADVDAALAPLGFEREERYYKPHLTVGRVRRRPVSLDFSLEETQYLGFQAQRVELVESTLTERGAVYETIETFALKERSRR